jgi:hypothetical protein
MPMADNRRTVPVGTRPYDPSVRPLEGRLQQNDGDAAACARWARSSSAISAIEWSDVQHSSRLLLESPPAHVHKLS